MTIIWHSRVSALSDQQTVIQEHHLQCDCCNQGHNRQSWLILHLNNNTFWESWLRTNQQLVKKKNIKLLKGQNLNITRIHFSRKQNVLPDTVFRRYICLSLYLSSTSNFFTTFATLCNNMRPQDKNITNIYIFWLRHSL